MPIDDFAAVWDKLCDNAFSDLQALVDDKMEDGELLPYVSAVLNRAEFKQATQGKECQGYVSVYKLLRALRRSSFVVTAGRGDSSETVSRERPTIIFDHKRRTNYVRPNPRVITFGKQARSTCRRTPFVNVLCSMVRSYAEKYKRFDQRNNLEEQVKHAKIDREEADEVMKQILAGEAQQRDTLERKMKSQAIDHR